MTTLIWDGAYDADSTRRVIETNDRAALIWCENATVLTGTDWRYLKVPQGELTRLQATEFADLPVALAP